MNRPDLYEDATYESVVERIRKLTPDTAPQWGTMNSARMCAHCAEVLEVSAGKPLEGTPWFVRLMGGLIKKMVLSDKPYPRNSRTHPQYVIDSDLEFGAEHARLLTAIDILRAAGAAPSRHPIFGKMTAEETGWSAYKHLDHHLSQFGL